LHDGRAFGELSSDKEGGLLNSCAFEAGKMFSMASDPGAGRIAPEFYRNKATE